MEDPHPTLSRWERWSDFTLRHAKIILIVVGALTVVMLVGMTRVKRGSNILDYYREGPRATLEEIEAHFNEGNSVELIFEAAGESSLFEPELLREQFRILQILKNRYQVKTHSIVDALDEGLRRVKKTSLSEIQDYGPVAEGMIGLAGGRTVRDLEKVSRHLLSHPEAVGFYTRFRVLQALSPMAEGAGEHRLKYSIPYVKAIKAFVEPPAGLAFEEQKDLLKKIRDTARQEAPKTLNVYLISKELVAAEIDDKNQQALLLMGLMVFGVDGLLFWAIFRRKREVLLICFLMLTSLIWTFGFAGYFGIQLQTLHMMVIPILVGTCDDDSIVFGRQYYAERGKSLGLREALRATFRKTGTPIFLTTFTTLVGFFSGSLPRAARAVISFNLLVGFSMIVLFLLLILLQGPLRRLRFMEREVDLPEKPNSTWYEKAAAFLTRGLDAFSLRLTQHRPKTLLALSGAVFLGAVLLFPRLQTEFSRRMFIRPDMQTYQAELAHEKYFGASKFGYLLFRGEVERLELLEKLRQFRDALAAHPHTEMVLGQPHFNSVLDLFEKKFISVPPSQPVGPVYAQWMTDAETAHYPLNRSFKEESENFLFRQGGKFQGMLSKFFINTNLGDEVRSYAAFMKATAERLGLDKIPGVTMEISGGEVGFYMEEGYFFRSMVISFFCSFVVNLLVLWVAWRRFKDTVLAILPILFSLALTVAFMVLLDIRLTVLNLMIGSILVGVGIDYPIHIIERFREEWGGGRVSRSQAMRQTLRTMGPSVWGGALTTMGGFAACTILSMPVAVSFGILMAVSIFFAYLGSVFILPVLLAPPWRNET